MDVSCSRFAQHIKVIKIAANFGAFNYKKKLKSGLQTYLCTIL